MNEEKKELPMHLIHTITNVIPKYNSHPYEFKFCKYSANSVFVFEYLVIILENK